MDAMGIKDSFCINYFFITDTSRPATHTHAERHTGKQNVHELVPGLGLALNEFLLSLVL